jgi:activator of HSP90 ATPase
MSNIHQEVTFAAPPDKVYRAILEELGKVTGAPTSGSTSEGGAFTAFGGYISGRQIELVPEKRVVQAWRAKPWVEGVYSIVRFELQADGAKTRLVFDHDGFPEGEKEHLSSGWQAQYWEPIRKYVES